MTEAYNVKYGPEFLDDVDLRGLEQLVEIGQTRFMVDALAYVCRQLKSQQPRTMQDLVASFDAYVEREGLEAIADKDADVPGNHSKARPIELAGTINRLRTLKVAIRP